MQLPTTFKIHVRPNSSKNEISYDKEKDMYKISIKAKPENNQANIAVIKFLSKMTKKNVKILKGLRNKEKVLRIE